jgi:hypothetical protein
VEILSQSEKTKEVTRPVNIPSNKKLQAERDGVDEFYSLRLSLLTTTSGLAVGTEAELLVARRELTKAWADAVVEVVGSQVTVDRQFEETRGDLVPLSVEKLHTLYREALKGGINIDLWTKSLTNRPKANFPEMMGTDLANVPPARGQDSDGSANGSLWVIWEQDLKLAGQDGFFACAVNPEAKTTVDNSYVSKFKRKVDKVSVVEEYEVIPAVYESVEIEEGIFESREVVPAVFASEEVVKEVTQVVPEEATYALTDNLKARRLKVHAYIGSLRQRGLRG